MIIIIRRFSFYAITSAIILLIAFVWIDMILPETIEAMNNNQIENEILNMFDLRNNAILLNDAEALGQIYNHKTRLGVWAYEHELKRAKYLHKWSEKQGVRFNSIKTVIHKVRVREREGGYRINFAATTTYIYSYINDSEKTNLFRIGTYHSMDIVPAREKWLITREWYTDPFADSLNLDEIKSVQITNFILSRNFENKSISKRQQSAVEYADKYCGAAADERYGIEYNSRYKNYNPLGGDCANFASQILFEGGKFKKNYTWNYDKEGSKAWVNAAAFKDYMLYSGRASLIAYGTYEKVYKAAFYLQPGDFVAYEKNGKVVHISVVTGWDSKGYPLVNSHNTDRYRVPWDLGWSNKDIKFWLVHVHF